MLDYRDTPRTQGLCSNKFTSDIDGFTDEPVVQCDFQIPFFPMENIFYLIH